MQLVLVPIKLSCKQFYSLLLT